MFSVRNMVGAVAAFALAAVSLAQYTFTIDTSQRRQTMDGFGFAASGTWHINVAQLYGNPAFAAMISQELRPAIVRIEIPSGLQPNEDLNPNTLNLANFNPAVYEPAATFVKRLHQANPNLKVFGTIWSPPAWMKDNNSTIQGKLRADRYPHFGKYCAAAAILWQQQSGVPMYGLSLQNEPRFANPFESCVYEPNEYRDAVLAVDSAFVRFGVNIPLIGAENVPFIRGWVVDYAQAVVSNPVARARMPIHGIHGFPNNGVFNLSELETWEEFKNQLAPLGFPKTWATEESGQEHSWFGDGDNGRGANWLAKSIHDSVVGGEVQAWVHWLLTEPGPSGTCLMVDDNTSGPKFHAFRHYARYIAPGSVRVEATPRDRTMLVSAFLNTKDQTVTVVVVNLANQWNNVTLNFNLPQGAILQNIKHVRSGITDRSVAQPDPLITNGNRTMIFMDRAGIATLVASYTTAAPSIRRSVKSAP